MGGTSPQAAISQAPSGGATASQSAPAGAAQDTKSEVDREKRDLAAAMDRIAARWRDRAQQQGLKTHPPVTEQSVSAPSGHVPPLPIRSEKLGTAPPSEDAKIPPEKGN